jgi:hypothetical protein
MTARRFRTEINGDVRVGLEFPSEQELEEFLCARGIVLVDVGGAPPPTGSAGQPKAPGRPSLHRVIAQAIEDLGERLDACGSVAAQARIVREHLKATMPPNASLPSVRTIRVFFTLHPESWRKIV